MWKYRILGDPASCNKLVQWVKKSCALFESLPQPSVISFPTFHDSKWSQRILMYVICNSRHSTKD